MLYRSLRDTLAVFVAFTAAAATAAPRAARKDIAIARVEMVHQACSRASTDDDAILRCTQEWLAWADEALPPSPHCLEHGALCSEMPRCEDAIAEGLTRYQSDEAFGFLLGMAEVDRACNEVALCGAVPVGQRAL